MQKETITTRIETVSGQKVLVKETTKPVEVETIRFTKEQLEQAKIPLLEQLEQRMGAIRQLQQAIDAIDIDINSLK